MKKLECAHADTCLSCYWGGHHLPHVQVPVYKGMHLSELKRQLHDEIAQGAIAGNDPIVRDDSGPEGDKWFAKAHAAINRIRPATKGKRRLFEDLEEVDPEDESIESVYAFFVFRPYEGED